MKRMLVAAVAALSLLAAVTPSRAQSPNNAGIVVIVTDESGLNVPDARVSVVNDQTAASRDAVTGAEGSASFPALSLTGTYAVTVSKQGFDDDVRRGIRLESGEVATLRVRLRVAGAASEVTVYGTHEGARADAQIGLTLDADAIDETPVLGRKITYLPLLNSAFRQGKGTGDLFVNATYFIAGAGSRRATTFVVDGANNDDGWGRQTMLTTLPMGAVEEAALLTNAFSAEYGWTSGPAFNIVTKSGTNTPRGELLYLGRPGALQADSFSTSGFCAPSVGTCETPSTLSAIKPTDQPDELHQASGTIGGPLVRGRTFYFVSADYTRQDRTTYLSDRLPSFVLPADGSLEYVGHYRQELVDVRVDHKLTPSQTLMARANYDHFYDTNPNDAVVGTRAPTVARRYTKGSVSGQLNHTAVIGAHLLNEVRGAWFEGSPVARWESQNPSTTYTRSGAVPFTIGESRASDITSRQLQISDTLTWSKGRHDVRFGGSLARHTSGGHGREPGTATLGTFTFRSNTTAPFDELTLADVQRYSEPVSYGVSSYEMRQWLWALFVQDRFRISDRLTLDAGLRYDRQTLTDSTTNFAPRVGFAWHPTDDGKLVVRGGYAMYYPQIRTNFLADALTGGLDGLVTYTATPGQTGFPDCLTCVPVGIDPTTLPLSQQPARNITIQAGRRSFYEQQFAAYGLDFGLLAGYPDELLNSRSQVMSIGAEREVAPGLFVGADYVHQHWSDLPDRIDLNAPTPFERTAPGQSRSVADANATRPIVPVNGGVRSVTTLMNLGVADYDGLETLVRYRRDRFQGSVSYTLSKATNTTEPDGNGFGPNETHISTLDARERGPSIVDQRHRAVIQATYAFPHNFTAGTLLQFASARPFNAVTGEDNNGDGSNNDRPVINGEVVERGAFRGTGTQDVGLFLEQRIPLHGHALLLRVEGFNLLNHANILGRGQDTYGDGAVADPTFGQVASAGSGVALPGLADIDPPRMFQVQVRFQF